jgi:hypothetical protein
MIIIIIISIRQMIEHCIKSQLRQQLKSGESRIVMLRDTGVEYRDTCYVSL